MFNFFQKTDAQIQQDVMNELDWDPSVTSGHITATSRDGIVTLYGSVPHFSEKSVAEEAAQRVGGVRAIADKLTVDLMGSYDRSDADIANATLSALEWSYAVPKNLKVTVENGWVTLNGEVEWSYQRNAAKNSIQKIMGVCGIKNEITIKSKVEVADVKKCIEEALKRSAENEEQNIYVEVSGDKVILTGNVHSFSESAEAGLAAWNAPGVNTVENNIYIIH